MAATTLDDPTTAQSQQPLSDEQRFLIMGALGFSPEALDSSNQDPLTPARTNAFNTAAAIVANTGNMNLVFNAVHDANANWTGDTNTQPYLNNLNQTLTSAAKSLGQTTIDNDQAKANVPEDKNNGQELRKAHYVGNVLIDDITGKAAEPNSYLVDGEVVTISSASMTTGADASPTGPSAAQSPAMGSGGTAGSTSVNADATVQPLQALAGSQAALQMAQAVMDGMGVNGAVDKQQEQIINQVVAFGLQHNIDPQLVQMAVFIGSQEQITPDNSLSDNIASALGKTLLPGGAQQIVDSYQAAKAKEADRAINLNGINLNPADFDKVKAMSPGGTNVDTISQVSGSSVPQGMLDRLGISSGPELGQQGSFAAAVRGAGRGTGGGTPGGSL